ncbi:expressed unknown protein [Seminavis robusta]|uniref:RING-type domain-containing protein n=1 Tax=Seminavis robusta TaxID=568900 RepID=A0A9N8DPV7_9STRA|nr:expressed unknown protein [Seminavis robusta]|eukprot:Sro175_g077030.1 n/a (704) ;mRNA; r:44455-46566
MSSLDVNDDKTETMCPVCWESIHDEKPVAVATGCGHIYHQACTHANNKKNNCLICQQPTKAFVDLFIRLPNVVNSSLRRSKNLVTKLEHEFQEVSRRTQLSLEKEIARREFEQTWLKEERQLRLTARGKVEERHAKAVQTLENNLKELQVNYERKLKMIERKKERRRSTNKQHDNPRFGHSLRSLQDEPVLDRSATNQEEDQEQQSSELNDQSSSAGLSDSHTDNQGRQETTPTVESGGQGTINSEVNAWPQSLVGVTSKQYEQSSSTNQVANPTEASRSDAILDVAAQQTRSNYSSRQTRADFHHSKQQQQATKPPPTGTRNRKSFSKYKASAPTIASLQPKPAVACAAPAWSDEDSKVPGNNDTKPPSPASSKSLPSSSCNKKRSPPSRKRKGQSTTTVATGKLFCDDSSWEDASTASAVLSVAEYERQRLQAETAYLQHQAELVEWERHQAEMELEQDELALQRREQRIRLERTRLEESFFSIQRRVEQSKQDARDRQKLTAMEEKFAKTNVARVKEDERFQQELDHLKLDDIQITERETWEKRRQENEKVRLKKEVEALVKVMNKLERAKELVKQFEEQSSSSQTQDTCVVCFDPLVNEESELGVAVPCGHSFHTKCFSGWEKSKRRRGSSASSSVPCPLCNVGTNLCVSIRLTRPSSSSSYCASASSASSLARHFQKEEGRWQRRRLTRAGLAREALP